MPAVDFLVETDISRSVRAKQLEAMFDVPAAKKCRLQWKGELPIDDIDWNVGLIVGPSGCGKSSVLRNVFGSPAELDWNGKAVVDDFKAGAGMEEIAAICQAVGFNTIPAWLRPFHVLSNGERFRVELARRLLELPDPIIVDEFTSVVDRQVAKIGAHAVQKYIRKHKRRFVAATCHYDVIDWLQPDWILEPATMAFTRRSLQPRPRLDATIARVPYDSWRMFAAFHYLTGNLHRSARCFCLFIDDQPTSFAGMLFRPHARVNDIIGCSRLVTLPDWQGLGLAMILVEKLGAAYKAMRFRLHTYPAHPALIRSFGKSAAWKMIQKPAGGMNSPRHGTTLSRQIGTGRPCAVFEYRGPAMEQRDAERLLMGALPAR